MAVAGSGLDDGHGRVHNDRADEACAAARNENVQIAVELHHLSRGLAGGVLDEVDGVFGQTAGGERLAHDLRQAHRGAEGLLAAAQDAGRAGLEAQRRRVDGDVRARLINDADHAHRDALLTDIEAVRASAHPEHLADRVGQGGYLTAALRDARNALFIEHQAVDEAVVQSGGSAIFDVDGVCRDDFVCTRLERVRDGKKRTVFIVRTELCDRVFRTSRVLGDFKKLSH